MAVTHGIGRYPANGTERTATHPSWNRRLSYLSLVLPVKQSTLERLVIWG